MAILYRSAQEGGKLPLRTRIGNGIADVGTGTLHAVRTFGMSAVGDAVNAFSPKAAVALEKYSGGMIPHTTQEDYESNRPGADYKWTNRVNAAANAGTNVMVGDLIGHYSPKLLGSVTNKARSVLGNTKLSGVLGAESRGLARATKLPAEEGGKELYNEMSPKAQLVYDRAMSRIANSAAKKVALPLARTSPSVYNRGAVLDEIFGNMPAEEIARRKAIMLRLPAEEFDVMAAKAGYNSVGNGYVTGNSMVTPEGYFKAGGKIHIKPENRGKFTATKKKTGKTTEELTHSTNPVTKKRAIFAANAKRWNHKKKAGGLLHAS